ncbi:IS1 family transposase [Candidatus Woesearchaeota archaeon]|nr:IS1 family transposase [Candidatus Woesearchaeota archaeon]
MKKRRKLDVSCQNTSCRFFGKKGLKNIVRRGKKPNGTQNYTCTECGKCFVRTAGTIFYRSRIRRKEAKQLANLLVEKIGIRGISRVTSRNKNTIMLFTDKLAYRCKQANEFLLKDIKLSPIEVDELWTFIKKNKRKLNKKTIKMLNRVTAMRTLQ